MERKLAAIFSADVKGYSRLMGEDEVATIHTVTTYREVMTTTIPQRRGRVVDTVGDNLLAEFASVVEAVQCAVAIQQELKARNAELPAHRRMEFRIGINLGDVLVNGERIYGDGVNIAARLESLAEGGGICITGSVYEQIKTKLALGYEDMGAQAVKNIAEPVRVYRVRLEPGVAAPPRLQRKLITAMWRQRAALVVVALLVLLGGGVSVWQLVSRPSSSSHVLSSMQTTALPLPDKPSIAVLPFVNMSGDPGQEYFSDGMTEDLITDLSKLSGLFVIARNSVFTYKGQAVKPERVSRELGVRYVLEGSVRKVGDWVRITAQLVEATTGFHRWAERYDRELQDVFGVQEEIARTIVTALAVQLTEGEKARLGRKYTDNLEAYDYYLRGLDYDNRLTPEANALARQMFEHAVNLDPQFAAAYAALSGSYSMDWGWRWNADPQTLKQALILAQRAVSLDDSLPMAHRALSGVYLWRQQHDQAIAEAERAIALDPNDAEGYATLAGILTFVGRPQDAIGLVEQAMRLNPQQQADYAWALGHAYYLMSRYEEAIAAFKRALIRYPNFMPAYAYLAAIYSELDQEEEARAALAEVQKINPQPPQQGSEWRLPYKNQGVYKRLLTAWATVPNPATRGLTESAGPATVPAAPSQVVGPLVIHAGQVIDGTGRDPLMDAVIVVDGGKITAIGQAGTIDTPRGATRIEVPGKTVIPGLIDTQVHYMDWMNPLFLRHGVTTARDVGNNLDVILILSPGRVWSEPGDGGMSRASFPFVLTNLSRNGLTTFLYDDTRVSALRFQVAQENAPGRDKYDGWGQAPLTYAPGPIADDEALRAQFAEELQQQTPIRPWSELPVASGAPELVGFDGGTVPDDLKASGVIIDGVIYLRGCETRAGLYPYCRQMRHTVQSVTKSLGVAVTLLRLAQTYGDQTFDLKIKKYVTVTAPHDGWERVTFAGALNVATGIGDHWPHREPNQPFADVFKTPQFLRFIGARTAKQRLDAAFSFDKYPWGPGGVLRYNDINTFILTAAMDSFLKHQVGPNAQLWDMVVAEVLRPIGIFQLPTMRTREAPEELGIPLLGHGLYLTIDDIAKLTTLSQHGGQHQGRQLLSPTKLAEALYQTKAMGLPSREENRFGEGRYHLSFWSVPYRTATGCVFQIPYMAGLGGNLVLLLPNGVSAFRLADGHDYHVDTMVLAGEAIRPFPCPAESGGAPPPPARQPLTADDLGAEVPGHTFSWEPVNIFPDVGGRRTMFASADGVLYGTFKGGLDDGTESDVGRWDITPEGQFCRTWHVRDGRREHCYAVYRDRETFEFYPQNRLGREVYRRMPGNLEGY